MDNGLWLVQRQQEIFFNKIMKPKPYITLWWNREGIWEHEGNVENTSRRRAESEARRGETRRLGGAEGRFKGGFFAFRLWAAYTRRDLFSEFYGKLLVPNTSATIQFSSVCLSGNQPLWHNADVQISCAAEELSNSVQGPFFQKMPMRTFRSKESKTHAGSCDMGKRIWSHTLWWNLT